MKQLINYAITIFLWILAIVLLLNGVFPYLFWLLLGLHFIGLLGIGYKTGKQYGVSAARSILMCMIFGYTWLLSLRRQIQIFPGL